MAPSCRLAVNIICIYLSTNKLVCAKDSFFVSKITYFYYFYMGMNYYFPYSYQLISHSFLTSQMLP